MQVWQLFHIILDYCEITKDNPTLYCKMVKYLLQHAKINGEQTIDSLTTISDDEWYSYFHGSLYSSYNVKKLQSMLRNINDFISAHGIRSIINKSSSPRTSHDVSSKIAWNAWKIEGTNTLPFLSSSSTIGFLGLFTGFIMGCAYAWYMNEI